MQNPILSAFKIAAFSILALFVGLSFFQDLKREDRENEILRRLGQVQGDQTTQGQRFREQADALNRLSGSVETLTGLLGRGAGGEEALQRLGRIQEEQTLLDQRLRDQAEFLNRLSGSIETLADLLARGALAAPRGPAAEPGGAGGEEPRGAPVASSPGRTLPTRTVPAATPPRAADATGAPASAPSPSVAGPPSDVRGRARELWGRYPDHLEPDPDPVPLIASDDPRIDPGGRFTFYYGSSPNKINAVTASEADLTVYVKEYCQETLAKRHDKNPSKFAPRIARRVEVNEDFTEWVVWLRPGVRWHKPQVDLTRYPHLAGVHEVTAHDFKFTLDLIQNPEVDAAHWRTYYVECEGIEVVDDLCYVIRWRKPWVPAGDSTLELWPMPRFVFAYDASGDPYEEARLGLAFNEHWFYRDGNWIGTGPYYVAEYDSGSHWLLKRNEDYWGELPTIAEMRGQIFAELSLRVKKLERGELDAAPLIVRDLEQRQGAGRNPFNDGRLATEWVWSTGTAFIAWKNTHPIFRDPQVRKAMTYACNRERVLQTLNSGHGLVITGPQHPRSAFVPPGLEPLPFDLGKARELLAQAGWRDTDGDGILDKEIDGQRRPFSFRAMVPNNDQFRPTFEIFKEDLAKIGVQMDLDLLQWQQFVERLNDRNFACTGLLWSSSGWESWPRQIWHSSQVDEVPSSNFIEFRDAEVDRLIEEAEVTFDLERRTELQRETHRRIHETHAYTWLWTAKLPLVYWQSRLANVGPSTEHRFRPFWRFSSMSIRASD